MANHNHHQDPKLNQDLKRIWDAIESIRSEQDSNSAANIKNQFHDQLLGLSGDDHPHYRNADCTVLWVKELESSAWSTSNSTFSTKKSFYFRKQAGLDTITGVWWIRNTSGGETAQGRVYVNSAIAALAETTESSYTAVTASADISALTDGNVYLLEIQIAEDGSGLTRVDSVMVLMEA